MNSLNIMAIVGSLRKDSVNGAIARAAASAGVDGVHLEAFDLADVALYNGDVEAAGLPEAVQQMQGRVAAADGLLIFSPEYNGSFPAVTKNAIDWFSRPPKSWEGTPLSMVTASPGPRAGLGVRTHFEAIMEFQPVRLFPSLGIGTYGDKMADGELADAATKAELADFIGRFATFCRQQD